MLQSQTVAINEIPELAKSIARQLRGGEILALVGDLGSGKTTFTKALGKQLKIKNHITSPTFMVMNLFKAKAGNKPVFFYHLDLYRTKNFKEVKALGITEIWGDPRTITVIEWADKIKRHLPKKTVLIKFKNEPK